MEIPSRFEPIIKDILQQLKEFELAYGTIPDVKLITKKNYNELVKLVQDKIYNQPQNKQ